MFGSPLHILIVHFPIALTLIALVYDAWAASGNRPDLHDTGYALTIWAALTSSAAVVTGFLLAGVTRIDAGALTGHALYGIGAGITSTAAGILRYSAVARNRKGFQKSWLLLEGAAALLAATAAVTGHLLGFAL
jgi:uncharacterized membrane protein